MVQYQKRNNFDNAGKVFLKQSYRSTFMSLSNKEIEELIKKLRIKYEQAARDYKNPGWFNLEAFEDRLQMALRNRMNLEGFIFSEVANFEKIKDKCEEKLRAEKRNGDDSFALRVNKIIEENTARIQKYRDIVFHQYASPEMRHLYGALSDFTELYFSVLWQLLSDPSHKNTVRRYEEQLSYLAVPRGSRNSKRIEDHILILSRGHHEDIEVEKDKNDYLKVSAFLLHEIINFTDALVSARNSEWENPLRFDKFYIEGEIRRKIVGNFSGLTGYGAILKVQNMALQIIQDFRLEAFRRKAVKH